MSVAREMFRILAMMVDGRWCEGGTVEAPRGFLHRR